MKTVKSTGCSELAAKTKRTDRGKARVLTARVIDGKLIAERVRARVARHATVLTKSGCPPKLAVVLVGDDPASKVYVKNKHRAAAEAGVISSIRQLPASTTEAELIGCLQELNDDSGVHGILCQLPLPGELREDLVINSIRPDKDVDGFNIANVGLLATGQASMIPCTPSGCLVLLRDQHQSLAGMRAVVVGRSNIVGKPMASLLLQNHCTVTIAHSRTRNIEALCREADILIAAVGRPEMVTGSWIRDGATVIDVGINRVPAPERGEGKFKLVGDVQFASAVERAGAVTPVPGGVGPMTIACLLANTITACCRINGISEPDDMLS